MSNSASRIAGVIFDLDGVLVSTDELHFRAWKEMADREGITFTHADNDRLRGIDRMGSLQIILERAPREYTPQEKAALAAAKNTRYRELLATLGADDALPGARSLLETLRARSLRSAVGSSSRNAREILARIELDRLMDVVVDGNDIQNAKPDPEVFLLAAARLGLPPDRCLVVEDADSGVEAARRGGFKVVRMGKQFSSERLPGELARTSLAELSVNDVLSM